MVRLTRRKSRAGVAGAKMICKLQNLLNAPLQLLSIVQSESLKWLKTGSGGDYFG